MTAKMLLSITACGLLMGCATDVPFAEADRGKTYGLAEFEKAVTGEKVAYYGNEIKNLRAPEPTDPNIVKLTPFMIREFPTLGEWRKMKMQSEPGDLVVEFHHRLFGHDYDGPPETGAHGFALVRNGRIIQFTYVNMSFSSDI